MMAGNSCPPPAEAGRLPCTALRGMFLRSFFIQACWNYERFQNLGFAFSLLPALRALYPDPARLKAAVQRHMGIFNTQPYMASFVLGNVARMEERVAAAVDPAAELKSLEGLKQALASSFASIGDRVFWGRLKPMTTQLCLLVWAATGFYGWLFTARWSEPPLWAVFAGPVSGILLYSAVAVLVRWRGINKGYACGGTEGCGLNAVDWPLIIRRLSSAGFAMSVALALLAAGLVFVKNAGCGAGLMTGKAALCVAVLVLHRAARATGRSVLFAAGVILAASVLFFCVLGFSPDRLYI